tara:strand:- start:195 stop:413 length:219 start_codon:yes stop_codon:yes gene_type:complete
MEYFNSKNFIGVVIIVLLLVALWPEEKNRLEHIEDRMEEVQEKRKILTDKEKELEKIANEKDWEEVDKDSNK